MVIGEKEVVDEVVEGRKSFVNLGAPGKLTYQCWRCYEKKHGKEGQLTRATKKGPVDVQGQTNEKCCNMHKKDAL